jgi:NitT/TauT family transport system permease protein
MKAHEFLFFVAIVALSAAYFMGSDAQAIPYLMLRTYLRMLGAYLLSLVFSVFVGLFIVHNRKAFAVIFPVLDIMQSVPILGYLPFAVLFIIQTIPVIGSEVASMVLIFTSMTWAIVFNVIEGARSIPGDLRDASRLIGLKGAGYLFDVLLPSIYGAVVSGSITGWGGGWYFLVAGEYVTFGKGNPYVLPGIGSFIAESAYSGDIIHSLIGMGILASMVLFMNIFVWGPMLARATRFSYSQTSGSETQSPRENIITLFLQKAYTSAKFFILRHLAKPTAFLMGFLSISPTAQIDDSKRLNIGDYAVLAAVVAAFVLVYLFSGKNHEDIGTIALFAIFTLLRISIGYIIALAAAVSLAIYIGRNQQLTEALMPLFDVAQSIPAIAVFPIIVVFVIHTIGGASGIQVASLMLLLTGMVWYLLFNLIRAVQAIPNDLIEAS